MHLERAPSIPVAAESDSEDHKLTDLEPEWERAVAVAAHIPGMEDEIYVSVGDELIIDTRFDDGEFGGIVSLVNAELPVSSFEFSY